MLQKAAALEFRILGLILKNYLPLVDLALILKNYLLPVALILKDYLLLVA